MSTSPRSSGAPGANGLTGTVRRVQDLRCAERDRMYTLLFSYFDNVSRPTFERDLAGKEWCILLVDREAEIQGFSTGALMRITVDGEPVVAVYSGDTIIARQHWGESALSRTWSRHAFALAEESRLKRPETRVYWFLISSGYKTYRFLPTFFREFYPTYERPTPPEVRRVMDALARARFPAEYDAHGGIIKPADAAPLKPDVARITARRMSDPHVAFFVRANPGHARGDELVCLTELLPENLTPAGRRMLGFAKEPRR